MCKIYVRPLLQGRWAKWQAPNWCETGFLLYTAVLEKCHCIFICEFMKNAFSCFVLFQRKFHFCDFRRNEKLRIFQFLKKRGFQGEYFPWRKCAFWEVCLSKVLLSIALFSDVSCQKCYWVLLFLHQDQKCLRGIRTILKKW